jgi:hypothetical protein
MIDLDNSYKTGGPICICGRPLKYENGKWICEGHGVEDDEE